MNFKGIAVQGICAVALAAAVSGGMAVAQSNSHVKDDLFAGTERFAKGASDVTEVTMDPDTLDMVSGDNARRAHNMVLNVVRTYEYPKPGMYNMADVDEYRKRLETGDWHCSIHTRDLKSGESTDICSKRRTDGLVEQAIITVEPKELTFIHTIRRPGGGEKGGPDGGSSLLISPAVDGELAAMGPELSARMAVPGPEMQAKMAALQPVLQARMAVLGPEMQAKMAAMQPELDAAMAKVQAQLAAAQKQLQRGDAGSQNDKQE